MPPESLSWDRKDIFKERKHERSESLGSAPRWRESSGSHHGGSRGFTRWGSADFRRPPGHGRQGGWHLFPEESGHGYMPSRSADKLSEDDGRRPVFRGDGRYNRSYRDNRGSFAQRDWKSGNSWETNSGPLHTGRPNDMDSSSRRSVDVVMYTSPPHSDSGNACDTRQLHSKEQHENVNVANGLNTGQKPDGENPPGSLEWKPLKWSRSGSLSSRGSGLSHSSSSKSMGGVDSNEAKVGLLSVNVNSVQSPSGDAAVCATSAAPCEEMTSRKKPRLGWGEGLAKYEKKKVEGPEDIVAKNGVEIFHSLDANVADKSVRVAGFSDCASPATPSSVACSSSPGVDEKSSVKNIIVDNEVNNLCESPGPISHNQQDGAVFNLEKLDMSSVDTLGNSLAEFLQSEDANSVDFSFVRSTAINKLLLLKDDALKTLEVTEMEIDKLENELKCLNSDTQINCQSTASFSSPSVEGKAQTLEDQCDASNTITRPAPLQVISQSNVDERTVPLCTGDMAERRAENKDEDLDSPGTATSKFVEPVSNVNLNLPSSVVNQNNCSADSNATQYGEDVRDQSAVDSLKVRADGTPSLADSMVVEGRNDSSVDDISEHDADNLLCQTILAENKEAAKEASEALLAIWPRNEAKFAIPQVTEATCDRIKEKFVMRSHLMKFKERVITLKFNAFHQLWKEDMRLLSLRKSRVKSQKKFEPSLRITLHGYQKHRSSIRSRFSSPVNGQVVTSPGISGTEVGNSSRGRTKEIVNYANQLLSNPQTMRCRSNLKMPALILDEREKAASRFISSNGLVEDPCNLEKERSMVNPWTSEEREIFLDKLAAFGKDFRKISSFLDHKTTADCVEFYYKNHKSDCFERTKKKKVEFGKQGKPLSSKTYMVTSGKRLNRELNTVSLDVLGDASLLAAQLEGKMLEEHMSSRMFSSGHCSNFQKSEGDYGVLDRTSSFDMLGSDREAVAADVLAGICGSISSEAMGSCITSSLDPGDLKFQKVNAATKRPLTPDIMENLEDETCSSESCGEMEPSDWTDDEKTALIEAVSLYGKDFAMISKCVRTRSVDQCKVFFSKARKCLGLEIMRPRGRATSSGAAEDDDNGGVDSDIDDACALGTMEDAPSSVLTKVQENGVSGPLTTLDLQVEANCSEPDGMDINGEVKEIVDTSKGGAELTIEHVDPLPELNVASSSVDRGGSQPLASSTPSKVVEPLLLKKSEMDINNDSCVQCSVQDQDVVTDSSSRPVEVGSGGLGINLNSDSKDEMLLSVGSPSIIPSAKKKAAVATQSEQGNLLGRVSSGGFDLSVRAEILQDSLESSPILRGYPVQVPAEAAKEDPSHSHEFSECFLRKCNNAAKQSLDQRNILSNSRVQNGKTITDTDKPSGTGDFKLFGQILSNTPSHHKSNNSNKPESNGNGPPQPPKLTAVTLPSSTTHSNVNGDGGRISTLMKHDQNNYVVHGNVPWRSHGFWDGNRIQTTGFSTTMPDSSLLLAKYPAAFSNYPLSTAAAKVEPQPLQVDSNLNGTNSPIFSLRELSNGSNGVFRPRDSASNKAPQQPFTLEMKQRQDPSSFSDPLRCNGFETVSGIQQPGMGMVVMNAVGRGGGVLVGGPYNGVSDPVAAFKMHFAQSEQMGSAGTGNIIRDSEAWRGKGDLGS